MDYHVPLLDTKVDRVYRGENVEKVPDLVLVNSNRYGDAEKGNSHLREINILERRKRNNTHGFLDLFTHGAAIAHLACYLTVALLRLIIGTAMVLDAETTTGVVVMNFLKMNGVHLLLASPVYFGIHLWCKRRYRRVVEKIVDMKSKGLVRTKMEAEIVDNPWYQFAHHAATLRDHFNKKAHSWNVMAEAIERGVFEMTDELRLYQEHLVSVRKQVLLVVNTAEFLVKRHHLEKQEGIGMSKHEITALLAQVDEARNRMDAVFELEDLPFDPAEVTQRAMVAMPDAVPEVDSKKLVQRALAPKATAGHC